MILRRNSAGRRHVARLAVVSLIGLGLVGLSGAANADKPGDQLANPSSGSDICLPKTPDGLPVHLKACLDPSSTDPSASTPTPTASPTATPTPTADPGQPGTGPICVPVPADLLNQLPADLRDQLPGSVPTCIPECLSDSVMHLLKQLPQDTLDELIADIESTLGELPACLESLLPSTPPAENPPSQHRHRHHHHLPPVNTHIPYHAGPAEPVGGSPDFTG